MRFDIYPGEWGSTYVKFQIDNDEHMLEMAPYVMCSDTLSGLIWATDALRWRDHEYIPNYDISPLGEERFLMTAKDRSEFYQFMNENDGWELIYSKDGNIPKKVRTNPNFCFENGDRGIRFHYKDNEMYLCHRYASLTEAEVSRLTKKKTDKRCVDCVMAGVLWQGEFDMARTQWILEKPALDGKDPKLHISLYLVPQGEASEKEYRYVVSYRDFCYALAAGVTRVYKTWGLMGFLKTVNYEGWKACSLGLEPFLRIKAYALGKEWCILPHRISKERSNTNCTSWFGYEMQILEEDMD